MPDTHILLPARHLSGFWSSPPFNETKPKVLDWAQFEGFFVTIELSINMLDGVRAMRYKYGVLRVHREVDKALVAIADFHMLESPGGVYEDDAYEETIEFACTDTPHEFVEKCQLIFGSVGAVFDVSKAIVHLNRLELLPDSGLKGRGLELGTALIEHLDKKYKVGAFYFDPFPLQYVVLDPSELKAGEVADEVGFQAGKKKLSELYARAWGACEVDSLTMVCSLRLLLERDEEDEIFYLVDPAMG